MSSAMPRESFSTAPSQPSAPHQAFAAAALGNTSAEAAHPNPVHPHAPPQNSDSLPPLRDEHSTNHLPGGSVVEEVTTTAAERTQLLTTPEAGAVLLSHPLQTGWFSRTAVLLCSHSPTTGAYGLCVNRTAATSTAQGK